MRNPPEPHDRPLGRHAGRRRRLQAHAGHRTAFPKLFDVTNPAKKRREIALEPIPLAGAAVSRDAQTGQPGRLRSQRRSTRHAAAPAKVSGSMFMTRISTLDDDGRSNGAPHVGRAFRRAVYEADQAGDLVNQFRLFRLSQHVPPQLEYIWDSGSAHGRAARLGRPSGCCGGSPVSCSSTRDTHVGYGRSLRDGVRELRGSRRGQVRRETYGEDFGQSSWVTADEYRRFFQM